MVDLMEKKILAIIPAFNEGQKIKSVIEETLKFLPVLVVDDGSADQTAILSEAAGARVIRQNPNQGKGAALLAGFEYALNRGYDAVLTLDADGQHDPQEIPLFLHQYAKENCDLIIGSREFFKMPLIRRIANIWGEKAFSWALRQPIRDNQSGYRLISSRLMNSVLASKERGFEFEVEMIVICAEKKFKMDWVPIQTIYADEKSHIKPIRHLFNFIRVIVQTRKRTKLL